MSEPTTRSVVTVHFWTLLDFTVRRLPAIRAWTCAWCGSTTETHAKTDLTWHKPDCPLTTYHELGDADWALSKVGQIQSLLDDAYEERDKARSQLEIITDDLRRYGEALIGSATSPGSDSDMQIRLAHMAIVDLAIGLWEKLNTGSTNGSDEIANEVTP